MDIGCPNQEEVGVDELGRDLCKFVRLDDVEHEPDGDDDDDDESKTASEVLSIKEPVQLLCPSISLVSAIKGSREKLGAAPRKLTVKWSPDVYDPVPNSLSHSVKGKQKSRKNNGKDYNSCSKKNKKGQKGKRGAGGKDKKQVRKHCERSDNRGQRTMDTVDRFVHRSNDLDDFGVGGPDCCGRSSFLQESLTKIHYSVAEV